MEAIRQTVRPKHQVLILKCYPRLPKNCSAAEIKPNGSELSYLLYYASSRRSKLSKVGTFLEKKTIHDLWKGRTAAVQITLQILTAFLNNPAIGGAGPQGFGLFAPYVLRIVKEVLRDANEAVVVESTLPTWDSFCKNQDHVALSADSEFRALFTEVVNLWAGYATKEQVQTDKATERRGRMRVGVTDNVKLRMAGLQALKSIADSDTLNSEAGRQLNAIMPVLLQNLYDGDGDLDQIMELNAEITTQEKEKTVRQKPSMNTIKDEEDGDARAAGATAAEADRLADQEASLLALRCLKSVFSRENRVMIRTATDCVLHFIVAHRPNPIRFGEPQNDEDVQQQWAVQLFAVICNWMPVQDRFVAVFGAAGMLIRSPATEDDLYRQLLLTRMISKILASDINLIGLSVMDVMLGLLQHIVKIIQASGSASLANGSYEISPNYGRVSGEHGSEKPSIAASPAIANESPKSPLRIRLLSQLQRCVANLAVHVYYTDQISDMIVAILARIRPSLGNGHGNTLHVPAQAASFTASVGHSVGEENGSATAGSDAGTTSHSNSRNGVRPGGAAFLFNTPGQRETALVAITNILICANTSSPNEKSYISTHRNPVPMSIWENTQWLIRDNDLGVKTAYIRAFSAWLDYELPQLGLQKAIEEENKADKERKRKSLNSDLARRAANSANAKKAAKRGQTAVLQSIHLAVVESLGLSDHEVSLLSDHARDSATSTSDGSLRTLVPKVSALSLTTPQVPTQTTVTSDLRSLHQQLIEISSSLSLPTLEEFKQNQVPALPPSTQFHLGFSPRPATSSATASDTGTNSPDADPRQPSHTPSFSNLRSERSRSSDNGRNRSTSSQTNGSTAAAPGSAMGTGRSARQDFATTGNAKPPKRPTAERSSSLRSLPGQGFNGLGLRSGSYGNGSDLRYTIGTGLSMDGRVRAVSSNGKGRRREREREREREGSDDASESMMEMEGSWGTSFLSPVRNREGKVDVRLLLEGVEVGNGQEGEGEGGGLKVPV